MSVIELPAKDPDDVEPYFVIWCSKDGTNDGSVNDSGELQGATISTSTWTVPAGLTEDSNNTNAVTIKGVSYGINTVATIWLSAGTNGGRYTLTNKITTSDSRTLSKSILIPVAESTT
jgi:hypothetical protein